MPAFSVSGCRLRMIPGRMWVVPAAGRLLMNPSGCANSRPAAGTYPFHPQPLAYSDRLMVKLPNTGASRWPLNSRVLW